MDHYVSIYRKDYTWPFVKSMGIKRGPVYATDIQRDTSCTCRKETKIPREFDGHVMGDSLEWSRMGPMGPLLDPKLFPARITSSPIRETSGVDEAEIYMKELKNRYPYLYGILQTAPPDEVVKRIESDRMKTTYMADYGDLSDFITPTHRDRLMEAAEIIPPEESKTSARQECPRIQSTRPKIYRPKTDKNGFGKTRREERGSLSTGPPIWRSEYQDTISKTGRTIMKSKLHHPKDRNTQQNLKLLCKPKDCSAN